MLLLLLLLLLPPVVRACGRPLCDGCVWNRPSSQRRIVHYYIDLTDDVDVVHVDYVVEEVVRPAGCSSSSGGGSSSGGSGGGEGHDYYYPSSWDDCACCGQFENTNSGKVQYIMSTHAISEISLNETRTAADQYASSFEFPNFGALNGSTNFAYQPLPATTTTTTTTDAWQLSTTFSYTNERTTTTTTITIPPEIAARSVCHSYLVWTLSENDLVVVTISTATTTDNHSCAAAGDAGTNLTCGVVVVFNHTTGAFISATDSSNVPNACIYNSATGILSNPPLPTLLIAGTPPEPCGGSYESVAVEVVVGQQNRVTLHPDTKSLWQCHVYDNRIGKCISAIFDESRQYGKILRQWIEVHHPSTTTTTASAAVTTTTTAADVGRSPVSIGAVLAVVVAACVLVAVVMVAVVVVAILRHRRGSTYGVRIKVERA